MNRPPVLGGLAERRETDDAETKNRTLEEEWSSDEILVDDARDSL